MTASGRFLSLDNPQPEQICISDIAEGLSKACRFAGQIKGFYSVAQHSLIISQVVPERDALWGLLHDAAEAYLCDIPSQVKAALPDYKKTENEVLSAIALRFGLPFDMPPSVKEADERLLVTEARSLCHPNHVLWTDERLEPYEFSIVPMEWRQARREFMNRFEELTVEAA